MRCGPSSRLPLHTFQYPPNHTLAHVRPPSPALYPHDRAFWDGFIWRLTGHAVVTLYPQRCASERSSFEPHIRPAWLLACRTACSKKRIAATAARPADPSATRRRRSRSARPRGCFPPRQAEGGRPTHSDDLSSLHLGTPASHKMT
ncbi:hypothetical protein PSPO01_04507 [Paraphaeosphaeria sporulosa]